jgi:hypothetical protein
MVDGGGERKLTRRGRPGIGSGLVLCAAILSFRTARRNKRLNLGGISLDLHRSEQGSAIVPVPVNLKGSREPWDATFSSLQLGKQQVDRSPADLIRMLLNPAPIRVHRGHVERN